MTNIILLCPNRKPAAELIRCGFASFTDILKASLLPRQTLVKDGAI